MTTSAHTASSTAAYLRRLGVDGTPPPTVETLHDLHRRHLAEIAYDNLGIMLGRPPGVAPEESLARVGAGGRAGYCFHNNGALEEVLRDLGFDVVRRHGHVWSDASQQDAESLNHLVLEVRGLPTEDNPGGRWWPDVGLGEGCPDPLPLVEGTYGVGQLAVEIRDVTADGWDYRHHGPGSFRGVLVRALPVGPDEVAAAHAELSTPPGPFTHVLVAQRMDGDEILTLRGCALTRVGPHTRSGTDVTSYDAWRAALVDELRLSLDDVGDEELRALHARMVLAHEAWVEKGRP